MKNNVNFLGKATAGFALVAFALFSSCEGTRLGTTGETADVVGTDANRVTVADYNNDRLFSDFSNTNFYEDWDLNDDNLLDQNEFSVSFYDTWDSNDDGILNDTEWNAGINKFGLDDDPEWDLNTWNANNDRIIDRNEFNTGFSSTNMYSTWDRDRDSFLNEREYSDGLFGMFDRDRNNLLDDNEYNDGYGGYFGV